MLSINKMLVDGAKMVLCLPCEQYPQLEGIPTLQFDQREIPSVDKTQG